MGKNLDNYVFWATAAAIITLGVYFGGNNHTELFPAWIFQLIELSFASLLTYVGIRKALTLKQSSVRIFNGIVTTISFFVSIDLAYRLIFGSSYVANGVTLGFLILLLLIGISVKLTQSIR